MPVPNLRIAALAALLVAGGCALLVWVSRTYNSAHTRPAAVETR